MSSNPIESVIELVTQYRNEFECSFKELKKQAIVIGNLTTKARTSQYLNELQRQLIRQRDDIVATIQDTRSAVPDLDTAKLLNAFSWMAIMLMGLSIGAVLGGVLFSPLISLFISGSDAALMAYFILPLTAYYIVQLPVEATFENDFLRRHALFSFATIEGLLTGYIFSNKDLIGTPPFAALTPIAVGMIPHFSSSLIGNDRSRLIWMTVGGGLIMHLCLGAIIELSLPYLLLAGLYALIGFAVLQLYVNNAGKDLALTHMCQLSFVCAVIFSQALVYAIFGLDENELAEATRSSTSFLL